MADEGKLVGSAKILPDELTRIISSISYSYTPAAGDQWYYKLTNVPISSPVDLIGGNFLQGSTTAAGTDAGSSPAAVATGDIVKFLFIKNTGKEHDGTTEIGPGESLALKINCTVADLHCEGGTPGFVTQALTTSKKIQCIVAAVLDDV